VLRQTATELAPMKTPLGLPGASRTELSMTELSMSALVPPMPKDHLRPEWLPAAHQRARSVVDNVVHRVVRQTRRAIRPESGRVSAQTHSRGNVVSNTVVF